MGNNTECFVTFCLLGRVGHRLSPVRLPVLPALLDVHPPPGAAGVGKSRPVLVQGGYGLHAQSQALGKQNHKESISIRKPIF